MVLLSARPRAPVSFYVALILGTLAHGAAVAGPGGGTVVNGSATITTEGSTTTVTNTPGTIINWEQFSVAPDEITRFVQQNAASTVLNRVTGTQGSEILGQILSNGRVFLINPNGIAIGAGARINTGGFVASSLDIADADFLSGRESFSGTGSEGRVINRGRIEASPGGAVYLIAPNVENHGVIRAPGGEILLAAGHSAELVSTASPNLRVRISAPEGAEAVNVGELVAQAGRIGLFGAVVRASGRLDASSARVNERGEIVLSAAGDAYIEAGAQLDAANSAGAGGSVLVEGARVAVLEHATVDVSGAGGGGEVRLGGDYLGANTDVRNASATVIAPTATVRADAHESGDGGRVIVWSDDYTGFHGSISARGGANAGHGGFVETSSRGNLQALGAVDASAPAGTSGEWLLDPYNITISAAASTNGSFDGASPNLFTPTGNSAVASRDTIQASLNGGTSVTVATGGTGSPGTQAGTIAVNAPITKSAGGDATLSLLAQSTITFGAGASISSTSGALGLTLTSAAGGVTLLPNIDLNGGTLTLTASATSTQATGAVISGNTSIVKAGGAQLRLQSGQTYTGSTTINGGSIVLLGANVLPDTTDVVVGAGSSLNLNGFADRVGSIAGAGNVALGAGTLTTGGNHSSTTLSGVVSGTGSLVKEGTGTFTLSGNNTYTGATTINAGTLRLGAANRIANNSLVTVNAGGTFDLNGFAETLGVLTGSGAVTLGAGTLTVGSGNVSSAFDGVISGAGGFTKSGTGTFTMGGANTYSGATSITGGTLLLGGAQRIADASAVTLSGGTTLNLNGFDETVGSLAGSGTVALGAGSLTTGGSNASTAYSGILSGTGAVTKTGTGTFTLSGINTFSGALNVNAGTLAFSGANRLTGNNAVTIAGGGTVNLANNSQSFGSLAGSGNVTLGSGTLTAGGNNTITDYSGVISGTGGFVKAGSGRLTLFGANTYTGATTVNAGALRIGANERLSNSSTLNVAAGALFELNSYSETLATIAGAGNIDLGNAPAGTLTTIGNGSTTFSGILEGDGAFTKGGTGTLTLSGANTHLGATQVNAGTLVAANGSALGSTTNGTTVASGATLRISNAALGNEAVTISGNGVSSAGAITGDGTASLAGPVTMAAASRLGTTNAASSLTLAGALDGAFALTTAGTGTVALDGVVGGTTALVSITQGATTPMRLGAGSVTTTGLQNWAGALALDADTTLASTANGAITLANVTGNGFDLTVNTGGATTLRNLAGVDAVTTDAPGTATVGGAGFNMLASNVTINEAAPGVCGTIGSGSGAVSFSGAVALCADTTINGTTVNFGSTVNSSSSTFRALTVNSSGDIDFRGTVGNGNRLSSLATSGAGVARFHAGTSSVASVRTSGAQTYDTAVALVATAAAQPRTFTSTGSGNITFNGALDASGSAANLAVNTAGTTTFASAVGGASALNTIATDAAGSLSITAPSIRTIGAQTYNDATASHSGTTTFATSGGNLVFAGAVTSGGTLDFDLGAGSNDATLTNAANDLGIVRVTSARNVAVRDANGLLVGPSTVTGSLSLTAGGVISQTGAIRAPTLTATTRNDLGASIILTNVANDADLLTLRVLDAAGAAPAPGTAQFADADSLSVQAIETASSSLVMAGGTLSVDGNVATGSVILRSGDDIVLGAGRTITATFAGTPMVLDAADRFVNNGATLSPGAGRWVIYSADPANDVFGGLASGNAPVWGATSATRAPGAVPAGNRYVFATGQTLAFTSTDVTKTYGDDATAAVAGAWTVSGFNTNTHGGAFLADDASTTFAGTPLVTSAGSAPTANVAGSPYVIDVAAGSLVATSGYTLGFDSAGRLTVDPRALAVVADDATKIYGDVDPLLTYVAAGLVNGDTLSGALAREPGETVAGSPYAINQGTLANSNYTVTFTPGEFTITPRGITVVANDATKVYGDVDPLLTYVATGLIGSDSLSGELAREPGETVAGSPYAITQGTLANANYTITFTGADFTITPRGITVVANDAIKVYGDVDPLLTYVATGLIGSDSLSGALARDPGETVAGSPYAITQGTLANSNYTITFTGADFTITPRGITVVADDATKVYGNADPVFTYMATGLINGDMLFGALARDPGETVAGSPYAITQGTLANSNYAITFTNGNFVITPRPVTVVANDATKVYGDADPLLTYLAAGLINGDTLAGALAREPGENVAGSPYAITQGTLANSNYVITFTNGEFTITRRPITVTADDKTRMMGLPDPPFTYVVSNLVAGDVLSGALTREPGETAAGSPYAILQGTVTDANNPNYAISYVPGELTITPHTISLDNRALQVGLERAARNPFTPSCFAKMDEDRLGKEFAKAQQRLDRAGKSPRARSSGVCRIAAL